MKKRIVTLVVFLLIACLMLTGCSSGDSGTNNPETPSTEPTMTTELTTEAPQSENGNADGMYEWTVRGVTIQTRTNIMDYIHDDVWECVRFSESLGWKLDAKIPDNYSWYSIIPTFNCNNATVALRSTNVVGGDRYGDKFCYGVSYYYGDRSTMHYVQMIDVYANKKQGDYYVDNKDFRYTITFDSIVYYTYLCEHLENNPDIDPLLELLGEPPHGISENYDL